MKKVIVVLMLLMVAATAGGWYLVLDYLNTPNNADQPTYITIKSGTTVNSATQQLENAGVITKGSWLYYYARATKKTALKAGEYEMPPKVTPQKALDILLSGAVRQLSVTVPEGLNLWEIAAILENNHLGSAAEYIKLCHDKNFLEANKVPGESCEGYLFPETYRFASGVAPKIVMSKMIELTHKELTADIQSAGAKLGLSANEIVILASLIQKETGIDAEMPQISRVFHNRLEKGMKLQTDPTVIYAKILDTGSYDGNITKKDLQRVHPYNTYTSCTALPPGPIASPGRKALAAAVNPVESNDLFFMATGDGGHEFCPTYACHERALERYLRKMGYKK